MDMRIDVPCVPLCELVFRDPSAPDDRSRQVTKRVDFDQVVRLFQAADHTYPLDNTTEEPQAADFDAIGARVAAYQEIVQGMAPYGPQPGQEVPPQTEGTLRGLRNALYLRWVGRQEEEKKTAGLPTPSASGSGNSNSGASPSAPSSAATPPPGPAGGLTSPGPSCPA